MGTVATRNYEDFDPSTETVEDKDCDIIVFHVPGFKKENLRVQVTATNFVRVSGEREIADRKFIRFQKEFPIAPDLNRITAKFEKDGAILRVRLPKEGRNMGAKLREGEGSKETVKDESGKTSREATAVDQVAKLKMARTAFYTVLFTLTALGVGLYLTKTIRSLGTPEI